MVIRLVAQSHTLLPEHPAALLIDVQASLDGISGGLFLEDAAHSAEWWNSEMTAATGGWPKRSSMCFRKY